MPTVTLISDLPASKLCAYVGLDNIVTTGHTAGYLLGRLASLSDGSESADSTARIKPVNSIILFKENLP